MDCKNFMESFLALDNGEALPPELADHRAGCSRCAAEADELLALMRTRAVFGEIPPPRDIAPAVMARVREGKAFAENRLLLSTMNWVSAGLLILLGMLLIPFSTILPGLSRVTPWIDLALPLVLGFVVTIYASFFTGSHMKALSRFLRLHS